jgi:hypothetical protein
MRRWVDYKSLDRETLIKTLYDNVLVGTETKDVKESILRLYECMSMAELYEKVEEKCNGELYITEIFKPTKQDLLERKHEKNMGKHGKDGKVVKVDKPEVKFETQYYQDCEVQTELFKKDWVKMVDIPCEGILMIAVNPGCEARCRKLLKLYNYKGAVIING